MTVRDDALRLTGVAQTLLLPLYYRMLDAEHPEPLVGDQIAGQIWSRVQCQKSLVRSAAHDRVMVMMRAREFDRRTRAFLASHPDATVIELGCGLDTRFNRVDNGRASWYELDLPNVIELRRQLLAESPHRRFIASSVLDLSWMNVVDAPAGSPVLLLAEGVLMYFDEIQVKALTCALRARFTGSQLICDVFSRFFVRMSLWLHPALRRMNATPRWGMVQSTDPETWDDGIRLVEEWTYFGQPEPRLGLMQLLRFAPPIANGARVVSYSLGGAKS